MTIYLHDIDPGGEWIQIAYEEDLVTLQRHDYFLLKQYAVKVGWEEDPTKEIQITD